MGTWSLMLRLARYPLSLGLVLIFTRISDGKINDLDTSGNLDGEEAMKSLEAAQVQMEQKLKAMTGLIEKELEKEKDSPHMLRKKRSAESEEGEEEAEHRGEKKNNKNPMMSFRPKEVFRVMSEMKLLEKAFDKLVEAYSGYKNKKEEESADDEVKEVPDDGVPDPDESEEETEIKSEENPEEVKDSTEEKPESGSREQSVENKSKSVEIPEDENTDKPEKEEEEGNATDKPEKEEEEGNATDKPEKEEEEEKEDDKPAEEEEEGKLKRRRRKKRRHRRRL